LIPGDTPPRGIPFIRGTRAILDRNRSRIETYLIGFNAEIY